MEHEAFVELTERAHFSRLLYPNPVCFLTTSRVEGGGLNVMTISWLTPANNDGLVVFSINKRRYSAECLATHPLFCLSVPVAGMEGLVLQVGKCSGRRGDKVNWLPGLDLCQEEPSSACSAPKCLDRFGALVDSSSDSGIDEPSEEVLGGAPEERSHAPTNPRPVKGTVAWMQCSVQSQSDADEGHFLVVARIVGASVHPRYWDGKNFAPKTETDPPYLTFLGSQKFAYVCPWQSSLPAGGSFEKRARPSS